MKYTLLTLFLLIYAISAYTQEVIQLSGLILTGANLEPVPYTSVYTKGKNRGTYSDYRGFFSFVAEKGETVVFSNIGYKTVLYKIPDTLQTDHYNIIQLMTQDTINLPETVIYPWPSREHFKLDFLSMDISNSLKERALANIAAENLKKMRNSVPHDGAESTNYYIRQQAKSYYHLGQTPPMNIFNPIAWAQFFKAWKDGKYKKQNNKY
ncbi:MAG: carboxypeptidase-like regulatory domain-containing protein [Saprospiraceae bacterium]|nr:carboxypeptidase-like regulatory domain-containing protein [Saprospiraceae bacterium]MBP7699624.1 carboxypeptidase-like regulatory domain-containing protein [Saprospiraceae bacterium]